MFWFLASKKSSLSPATTPTGAWYQINYTAYLANLYYYQKATDVRLLQLPLGGNVSEGETTKHHSLMHLHESILGQVTRSLVGLTHWTKSSSRFFSGRAARTDPSLAGSFTGLMAIIMIMPGSNFFRAVHDGLDVGLSVCANKLSWAWSSFCTCVWGVSMQLTFYRRLLHMYSPILKHLGKPTHRMNSSLGMRFGGTRSGLEQIHIYVCQAITS